MMAAKLMALILLLITIVVCAGVYPPIADGKSKFRKRKARLGSSQWISSKQTDQEDKVPAIDMRMDDSTTTSVNGAGIGAQNDRNSGDSEGVAAEEAMPSFLGRRALSVDSTGAEVKRSRRSSDPNPTHNHSELGSIIHWTVFSNWQVLVGLSVFEVIVYVVTVSVIMVLHSKHRNQVGSIREGALTSKYQFTL